MKITKVKCNVAEIISEVFDYECLTDIIYTLIALKEGSDCPTEKLIENLELRKQEFGAILERRCRRPDRNDLSNYSVEIKHEYYFFRLYECKGYTSAKFICPLENKHGSPVAEVTTNFIMHTEIKDFPQWRKPVVPYKLYFEYYFINPC